MERIVGAIASLSIDIEWMLESSRRKQTFSKRVENILNISPIVNVSEDHRRSSFRFFTQNVFRLGRRRKNFARCEEGVDLFGKSVDSNCWCNSLDRCIVNIGILNKNILNISPIVNRLSILFIIDLLFTSLSFKYLTQRLFVSGRKKIILLDTKVDGFIWRKRGIE